MRRQLLLFLERAYTALTAPQPSCPSTSITVGAEVLDRVLDRARDEIVGIVSGDARHEQLTDRLDEDELRDDARIGAD